MADIFNSKRPTVTPLDTNDIEIVIPNDMAHDTHLYLANPGAETINYEIFGSPSGAVTGHRDADSLLSPTQIALERISIVSSTITTGAKKTEDVSAIPYPFLIMVVSAAANTTTLQHWLMSRGVFIG